MNEIEVLKSKLEAQEKVIEELKELIPERPSDIHLEALSITVDAQRHLLNKQKDEIADLNSVITAMNKQAIKNNEYDKFQADLHRKHIESLNSEIKELTQKGEELCTVYGTALIKIHDQKSIIEMMEEILDTEELEMEAMSNLSQGGEFNSGAAFIIDRIAKINKEVLVAVREHKEKYK